MPRKVVDLRTSMPKRTSTSARHPTDPMLDAAVISTARSILLQLASGTDPIGGSPLEPGGAMHRPEVIRALFVAAEVMGNATRRWPPQRPTRTGGKDV